MPTAGQPGGPLRLAGRFTIERLAGTGGMGNVYHARDEETGRAVALKLLHEGGLSAADVERFNREASLLAELAHPGIVGYVAHGVDEKASPYLAMEWVEGKTLAARLAEPLTRDESLALVGSVAEALGAAHARGIVHRDVKPSNIVLHGGDLRQPRLLDFGIARHHDGDRALTQTGAVIGTPGYMAPEQARGLTSVDARADVYALGCLLFRCLAGRTPFAGAQVVAVLARTIIEDAPRVRELCPDVSPSLDDLVARLLSRDPSARPRDGAAVAEEISKITRDETDAAPLSLSLPDAITSSEQRFVTAILGSPSPAGAVATGAASDSAAAAASAASVGPAPTATDVDEPPATQLTRSLTAITSIAAAHDARCELLADGSFLLVFATSSAPTDLATRACRASLSVRALDAGVAVAVVSGRMLVRGSLPIGELLDRAALALEAAGPGGIAIDEATASLVGDRFTYESTGGVIRLLRPTGQSNHVGGRTLLGRPTPCVGRDRELSFLEGLVRESVEEKAARVALIVAPAGAGKSRLRRELVLRIAQQESAPLVLLALGDPMGNSGPLGLLGEALRRAAGLFDLESRADESTETLHLARWLGRRLDTGQAASTVAPLLEAAGLGSPDPFSGRGTDAARAATLRAWIQWLGAELEARPVVVVLEDLHWGDEPSVEFLDASLRAFAKKRFTVLALGRPEVKKVFPNLWADREPQELRLGPLTRAASAQLVRSVITEPDETTVTVLVERAAGNAFFLEELIRALADGGAAALPDTVLAVIQARLDALGPELTRVLRAASVFGDTFWQQGVAAVLGMASDSRRLGIWLDALVDRELIERKPETTIANAQELVFRHDMVREGAYAMLTEEDARLAHRLAGEWLESAGVRDAPALAEHFERGKETARAIYWSCIDAERAVDALDFSAFKRAERGIRLGAKGAELGRLLSAQADTLDRRSDLDALGLAERALELLPRASPEWYRTAMVRLSSLAKAGHTERFVAAATTLAETTPRAGDTAAEVEYVVAVGEAIVVSARTETPAAITLMVAALGPFLPRAAELPPRAGACLESVMSMGSALAKMPEAALRGAQRAVEHQRSAGELTHLAEITVAQRLAFLGETDEGMRIVDRVLAEGERIGFELILSVSRFARAFAMVCYENYKEAYKLARAVRDSRDPHIEPMLNARLDLLIAKCAFRTRRIAEGEETIAGCLARLSAASPLWARAEMVRAEGLLADGHAREAVEIIEKTRPLVQPTPFDQDEAEFALLHARGLLELGEDSNARKVIATSAAALRSCANGIGDIRLREGFLSRVPAHRDLLLLAVARGL